jgi:hypothetical protein
MPMPAEVQHNVEMIQKNVSLGITQCRNITDRMSSEKKKKHYEVITPKECKLRKNLTFSGVKIYETNNRDFWKAAAKNTASAGHAVHVKI